MRCDDCLRHTCGMCQYKGVSDPAHVPVETASRMGLCRHLGPGDKPVREIAEETDLAMGRMGMKTIIARQISYSRQRKRSVVT